ncbi:MAG: rhamnulokinase [Oscillospiraceae bacterium]|jgi:rhamnulokinase/L-fuculokinase|nr:rhamnulokinase [Oscillospiraceae bacterium]
MSGHAAVTVLPIDLGASSGRVMCATLENERITLREVHRFANAPVRLDEQWCWDAPRLLSEIKQGIALAAETSDFASIGIDTWGVDFALVDLAQERFSPPVSYRDARTQGTRTQVAALIPEKELFAHSGVQPMEINTLYQLFALRQSHPALFDDPTDRAMLLMPDFFGWLLTGRTAAELSIASTTGLLDIVQKNWDVDLLAQLGIPQAWFPLIVPSGTVLGDLKPSLCAEMGIAPKPVISVLGHDTASAVLAVPAQEEPFLFISCGTWSIVGTEQAAPVRSEEAAALGLTNELGFGGKAELLQNIVGLWLLQETRRCFAQRDGTAPSFKELADWAQSAPPFAFLIDPNAPEFMPPGDMPARIRAWCRASGQGAPESDAQLLRCIYDSLALQYRAAAEGLETLTDQHFATAYMVGGGAQSALLCRLTAAALARPLVAGPFEATALGNAALQLMTLGHLRSAAHARAVIRESFALQTYAPEPTLTQQAEDAYARFCGLCKAENNL